jgi:hypothetical protein
MGKWTREDRPTMNVCRRSIKYSCPEWGPDVTRITTAIGFPLALRPHYSFVLEMSPGINPEARILTRTGLKEPL